MISSKAKQSTKIGPWMRS